MRAILRGQLGRVSLNAINTCDGSGATGLGLFPEAAMFNHGCCPNCQAWWRGSKVRLCEARPSQCHQAASLQLARSLSRTVDPEKDPGEIQQ